MINVILNCMVIFFANILRIPVKQLKNKTYEKIYPLILPYLKNTKLNKKYL